MNTKTKVYELNNLRCRR